MSTGNTKIVTLTCQNCGVKFDIPYHKAGRRTYCSATCARKAVRMNIIPGSSPPGYKPNK